MSDNPTNHINARISAARRAFYGLQGAGLCSSGVAPHTAAYIYNVAIQPVLSIGCATVNINPVRSGLFQTANDPGGGALKAPPPTILKTIVSIFTISYMCILPGV